MIDSVYIAWKYLTFNKARTATLVACVTLIAVLPLSLELLLAESERQLLSRAESTPLLLGARGSALDLVMNSLYFDDEVTELISVAALDEIDATGPAWPIPLYVRFDAAKPYQLVVPGTVIDGLLANIFRIKNVLDAVILVVGTATGLALILVFALSLRLRQREISTVFRIGGSRLTIARFLAAEIAIIILLSGLLCAAAMVVVDHYSEVLVRGFFTG